MAKTNKNSKTTQKKYVCKACNSRPMLKHNYASHLETVKHKKNQQTYEEELRKEEEDLRKFRKSKKGLIKKKGELAGRQRTKNFIGEFLLSNIANRGPLSMREKLIDDYIKISKETSKIEEVIEANERLEEIYEVIGRPDRTPKVDINLLVANPALDNEIIEEAKDFLKGTNLRWFTYDGDRKRIFIRNEINPNSIEELKNSLREQYRSRKERRANAYKVNVVLSAVALKPTIKFRKEEGEGYEDDGEPDYEFVRIDPGRNTTLFTQNNKLNLPTGPLVISDDRSFESFINYITLANFNSVIINAFPMSGLALVGYPAIFIEESNMNQLLGAKIKLPEDIINSRSIISMNTIDNNKCFFFCIAKHLVPEKRVDKLNTKAKEIFNIIYKKTKKWNSNFKGVTVDEIYRSNIEDTLNLKINIYEYGENIDDIKPHKLSDSDHETTVSLLKYKNHLMLITDVDLVLKKTICPRCKKFFDERRRLNEHIKRGGCALDKVNQIDIFTKKEMGWFVRESNLKLLLIKYGLPHDNIDLDNILTYDFESMAVTDNKKDNSENIKYLGQHIPISFSISYRIGDSEIKTITHIYDEFEYDPVKLTKKFVDTVIDISIESFRYYYAKFDKLIEVMDENDIDLFVSATPLICLGFNSNRFDIKVLTNFMFYQYLFDSPKWENVMGFNLTSIDNQIIKDKIIQVKTVRFVDQMLWTMGSLDNFIKGFLPNEPLGKLVFPHGITRKYKKLRSKKFNKDNFPRKVFFNDMRRKELDEATYDMLFEVAKEKNVKTFRDFLVLYNEQDVIPFLKACEVFRNTIRSISIEHFGEYMDPYQDSMGMPSLASEALKLMARKPYWEPFVENWGISEYEAAYFEDPRWLTKNYFETIYSKCKEKDEKYSEEHEEELITNLSFNWFTNKVASQCGKCLTCRKELTNIEKNYDRSKTTLELAKIDQSKGFEENNTVILCTFCNKKRNGRSISTLEHDNMVFEFNANHSAGLLMTTSKEKKGIFYLLKEKGIVGGPSMVFHRYHKVGETRIRHTVYNPDSEEYELGPKQNEVKLIVSLDANSLYPWAYMGDMPVGEGELITVTSDKNKINSGECKYYQEVISDKLFGFIECSMRVKEGYESFYCEHPPFYVTREINGVKKLSSYLEVHDILISTTLFNWYMSKEGIECTKISKIISYGRSKPFESFVELGANMRRDDTNKVAGDVFKLMLNSAFGKMAQNNNSYDSTLFTTDEEKAYKKINKPEFKGGEEYVGNKETKTLFEVTCMKKDVRQNMPIQGAAMIFSQAKLRMLQFVYDFIDKYIDRSNYQLCYTDTDSMWIAFASEKPFEDLIKPELRDEFEKERNNFLTSDKYSERTPGLFKTEYLASELICLSSKSYFAKPFVGEKPKFGAKGIQGHNVNFEQYREALFEGKESVATNRGFIFKKAAHGMQQYEQTKRGVNSDYDKRGLLDNGINTYPIKWE